MEQIDEKTIRAAFINCSKGEASRINLPSDFAKLPWSDLEFLGWRDPRAHERAYIVTPWQERLVGISLRAPSSAKKNGFRSSMCMVCLTLHTSSEVGLFAANKAGSAGRQGNTVGLYICSDLACSLYVRGKRRPSASQAAETLDLPSRLARIHSNLQGFIRHVFDE